MAAMRPGRAAKDPSAAAASRNAKGLQFISGELWVVFRHVEAAVSGKTFKRNVSEGLTVCGAARRDIEHGRSP